MIERKGQVYLNYFQENHLASALGEIRGEKNIDHYQTLRQVIRKGIALGYIKESEYDRWVYSE